jgi:hypothetical protein
MRSERIALPRWYVERGGGSLIRREEETGTADYPSFHRDPVNLLVHVVMVPVFDAGVIAAVLSAFSGRWAWAAACAAVPVLSLAVQGIGHKREGTPPLPFRGAGDFVKRVVAEQFYKFPAFVTSGRWLDALRESRRSLARDGP